MPAVGDRDGAQLRPLGIVGRLRRDHDLMLENLGAVQTKCSLLLEETREARRELAALGELSEVTRELGEDERKVLVVLARRLLDGQRHYGRLSVATDGRDWRKERAEELADALVYTAIAEVAALR